MWPAVKEAFTQEGFRQRVAKTLWTGWRPSKIVWHNTAAPSLAQWIKSAKDDQTRGLVPGITRIRNLEKFFRDDNHWSGCPHLFIANDAIWIMNPLDHPGVHTPSWNTTSIGIETIGDFDKEDDDAGEGLKVKNNTIFATAILCSAIGLDPLNAIFLHKQDTRTTHDCPGKDMADDKAAMIADVADLMAGGEHDPGDVGVVISGNMPIKSETVALGLVLIDDLSFRTGPGAANHSTGSLTKGTKLEVIGSARNGTSQWLKVKTPAGFIGWVAGKYVQQETA